MTDSAVAVFAYEAARDSFNLPNARPAPLTAAERRWAISLLEIYLTEYNRKQLQAARPGASIDTTALIRLPRYKLHMIPSFNAQGEKVVWVACTCELVMPDWRQNILLVMDGGNCYFTLKVNLTRGSCTDLAINGVA